MNSVQRKHSRVIGEQLEIQNVYIATLFSPLKQTHQFYELKFLLANSKPELDNGYERDLIKISIGSSKIILVSCNFNWVVAFNSLIENSTHQSILQDQDKN